MGAPTGNGMHDSARELTEMASTQFAFYGLMNPYTYQRPKITLLPNETGLTVPGGTGVAVVPNGTAPALKQPYLPGQYTEYPAAVQGWAQQALPGGGSGIESGKYSAFGEMSEADGVRYRDWNYQKIHEISIHNPNVGSMTLGKYFDGTIESGSYVARAELTGDTYFSLGTQWNDITKAYGLSDKEMFNLFNTRALDDAVRQGKSIRFSQNPLEWKGTALGDEWLYLQSKHGYTRLKKIGDYWYAK